MKAGSNVNSTNVNDPLKTQTEFNSTNSNYSKDSVALSILYC